ncbi:unnamed protein product [Prunus armeniaca]
MLAYTLSKAPLGLAYIFTSFPSSDSAKAGGRKEEKTVTKKASSHYAAAGKGDIELPKFPEFEQINRGKFCKEREVREEEEKGGKSLAKISRSH